MSNCLQERIHSNLMKDDVEELLTRIITKVTSSTLRDREKADVLSQLPVGMRKIVWPILLAHAPEYLFKETGRVEQFSMDDYVELINASLSNPATAKEMHDELKAALEEVEQLLIKSLS